MNDPWNPSWEDVQAWAYDGAADHPCEDWDLACSWAGGYVGEYVRLAADAACPKRHFFLHVIYLMVGDAVRRGDPTWRVEAFVEKGDGVRHGDIRRWQQRSRQLLAAPETFSYADWCGGGLAGLRDAVDEDELLHPWTTTGLTPALEQELERELGKGHPLAGATARAIARRDDTDDVLFALEGGPAPFAVVHLTWSGTPENDPRWPSFSAYQTLAEWKAVRMRADHDDWSS